MSYQAAYNPQLDHLHNCAAASEIEFRRLLEREESLNRQLSEAGARRDDLLREYGRPVTRPLQPEAYPAKSLPGTIIALNQTIADLNEALSKVRHQLRDQETMVRAAHETLASYQSQLAGLASGAPALATRQASSLVYAP